MDTLMNEGIFESIPRNKKAKAIQKHYRAQLNILKQSSHLRPVFTEILKVSLPYEAKNEDKLS